MKKLWTVTIETEIVVVAETQEDAVDTAEDAMSDLSSYDYSTHAAEMVHLPSGWDKGSLPWGDNEPEQTTQQWIDAGAAPAYVASQAAWAERRAKAQAAAVAANGTAPTGSAAGGDK